MLINLVVMGRVVDGLSDCIADFDRIAGSHRSRAIDNLNRILEFSTDKEVGAFKRSRRPTVWQALVALRKIDGSHPLESPPECTCEICKSDLRSLGLWKPPWWKRLFGAR